MQTFTKDPAADLDFYVDWSEWLADGETIAQSEFTIPDGIESHDDGNNDTASVVWLSGGSPGRRYRVTNQITTSEDRIDERTLIIEVQNR